MSSGKRKAPNSGETGESKVFLLSTPTIGQKGSGGLPEAERGGKGRHGVPNHHGASSLCSLAMVPAWAVAACWHHWTCCGPFPSTTLPPASMAGMEQNAGDSPQGHLAPQGAHCSSHLFSPLQHVCCVAGWMLTQTSAGAHLQTVEFTSMSSAW